MANDLYGDAVETLDQPPAAPPPVAPSSPDAPNPYDEMFQAQDVGRQQQLRTSIVQAADTSPDRAADVQQLSTQTGISADIVGRNYDAIKKRALLRTVPYAQIQRDSPATAAFLSEPEHAAVAHDDMENLGNLEWVLTAPQRAIIQANAEQDYAALRTKAIFGTLTADERARMDTAKVAAEQGGKLGAGDSWFRGAITSGAKMLQFISAAAPAALVGTIGGGIVGGALGIPGGPPGVVAGAVTGGTEGFTLGSSLGLANVAFTTSAGPAYDRYLAMADTTGRPLDVDIARAAAITEGAINGALMGKIPGATKLLAALHAIPGADKLTSLAVGSAITEALKQPTIRAALGTMMQRYAGNLSHGTALMVAQDAVSILGGELAKTVASATAPTTPPDYGYGNRYGTTTPKGLGFFGPLQGPDGQVRSEFSIGVDLNGKETEIPSLVPTLTSAEVSQLLALRDGEAMPPAIRVKAEAFARQRIAAGHDPFAAAGEQQATYPELARAPVPAVKPAPGQFDHISAADAAAQLWQATTNAVQSLAIISGVGPAMTFAHDANRAIRAQQGPAFFTALGEGVAQSKTAQRLPQAAQDFLAQATKNGPVETVYAPLDTWNAHWLEQQVDPKGMAEKVTGDPEAYDKAMLAGTDLPIPTARYATTLAATEHNGFFANELKLSPEAMNARESAAWLAEQKAKAAEPQASSPQLSAVERVHQDLLDQQVKVGTPADVAEQHAALVSAGFGALAERAGLNPADVYRAYGITVERPEGNVPRATADAADVQPTAEIAPSPALAPTQDTTAATTEVSATDAIARLTDSQPERRRVTGEPPGGVERRAARDEPINAMADIPAAAARMLAENPDLVRHAEAMRAQADAVGRIPEPVGRPTSPLGNAIVDTINHGLDTAAASAETGVPHAPDREAGLPTDRQGRAADAGVSASRPRERESAAQRDRRTADHYAAVFADLADAARALDPAVDPADLKAEFDFRLEALGALDEGATDTHDLLRQIAKYGGINTVDATFPGEVRWLQDGMKFGRIAGHSVFTRDGVSLDDMLTQLHQDPQYRWIENTSMLLDALDSTIRNPKGVEGVLPGTDELAAAVKMDPAVAWWKDSWRPKPAVEEAAPVDEGTIAESDAGDTSFKVDEFDQSAKPRTKNVPGDLLDTGELQPRLPGDVGAVQDANVAMPQLEVPFALTSEAAKPTKGRQDTLFQEGPQQRRGSVRFEAGRTTINLFAQADLSTFVHESGHLFLEVLGDVTDKLKALDPATLTPEQGRLLQDHQTILTALGVENRSAIGRAQHEQVANWFESYLMEGKAPSVELQPAFSRFRAWILDVYRALRSLKAPLTNEVRGVFDRLLASDQAIADAEARRGQPAMFLTAKDAGMTPERFALYRDAVETAHATAQQQLDQQLLADVRREQTARWKAQQVETRAAVEREVQQQPVYRALAAIRDGTHPDGTPLVDGQAPEPLKLSRAILVERYGEAAVARFPAEILTRDGGLDPDALAEGFGFASGDALLHAIDRAPAIADVVDRETQQRMLREHGSLLLDGTLPEKADVAIANDAREQVVRAEIAALWAREQDVSPFVTAGKIALAEQEKQQAYERRWFEAEAKLRIAIAEGRKQVEIDALTKEVQALKRQARGGAATIRAGIPSAAAMKEAARVRIEATIVRALKPQEFWSASRRAAQQAIERAARQDFTGAITAKTLELLALHLYRAAEAAKADVETRVAAAGRLDRPGTRKTLGLAGGGFLDQIDGLLDRFGFSPADPAVLDRKASLEAWQTAKQADGMPVDLPALVLNGEFRKLYPDLTVAQFRDVTDALAQLAHLARAQGRTFKNAAADAFRVERDGLVASIRDKNVVHKLPLEFGAAERRKLSIGDYFASLTKISILARNLDGSQDGGPMWESFIRRANEASDAEQTRNVETGQRMADILEQHYPGRERVSLRQRSEVPGVGSMSKEMRLAVALNWGTETGQDRLLSDPVKKWTREQVETILGTLDRRDWSFVQDTWKLIGSFWPEIAAKQERVVGVAPEKVAGVTVHTKYGDIEGAYYPLKYDGRLASRAVQLELAGVAKMQQGAAYVRSTTQRGFVETRLTHVELPIRYEFGVAFQHLGQVIHDLTHHEMLIDATRLLRDKQVSEAIYETKGSNTYKQFTSAFQDIATGLAPVTDQVQWMANFLRTGMQIKSLGFNLMVGLKHPMGVFNGAAYIGPEWMAKGVARAAGDALHVQNTLDWIKERSPMMRERGHTSTVELHDLAGEMRSAGGWFDALVRTMSADRLTQQTITNGYLWHIGLLQQVADIPTWLGGYEKAMEAQRRAGGAIDETRAFRLADQAVLDSQGGGTIKDLARIQRGGPYARLWMTFYSYGARVFNSTAEAAGKTEFRSPASVIKFLGNLSLIYLMPAMWTAATAQASGKIRQGEDQAAAFVKETGKDMLAAALNGLVGIRELSGPLIYGRDYTGPPASQVVQLIAHAAKEVEQGELDEPLLESIDDVLGVLLHYPASQIHRTVAGWEALRDGRTENPLALVSGGPPKAK